MATVTFQLSGLAQEGSATNLPAQNQTSTPSANSNPAQGGAAPEDTVTLTTQVDQGQNSSKNQQSPTPEDFHVSAAVIFPPNGQTPSSQPPAEQASPAQPPTNAPQQQQVAAAQSAPQTANPSATNSSAASQAAGFQTPQQQLAQLEQVLQQLGIDPQTLSLFNQLSLLPYANDPAALQAFVKQIDGSATTSQTTNQTPAQERGSFQISQSQAASVDSAPTFTPDSLPAPAGSENSNSALAQPQIAISGISQIQSQSQSRANQSTGLAQFQELQLAFAGTGSPPDSAASGQSVASGTAVNITI